MKRIISDEAIAASGSCCLAKACLGEDPPSLCKVVFCVDSKLLGVACGESDPCRYQHVMEDRTLCTCPVRMEIYEKYGV